ncbi:MAG: pentapeptide repeat-containing protein [Chloroflexota bacterium]
MSNQNLTKVRHDLLWGVRDLYQKFTRWLPSLSAAAPAAGGSSTTRELQGKPYCVVQPLSALLSKLRSREPFIVKQAVEELRARGNLSDNTLAWVRLRYANLQGLDLSAANLHNADLERANLERTDLAYANLEGARLIRAKMQGARLDKACLAGANLVGAGLQSAVVSDEQLARAGRLRGAMLPDGSRYDGRYNLPGDFVDASILHVDLDNPEEIAAFYGVPLADFLRGQQWRQANLPSDLAWSASHGFQNAEQIMNWL